MLTIIGCGNPNRSDDGVGVAVVKSLKAQLPTKLPDGVRIFDAGTDGMGVMFQARGTTKLIVIDACSTSAEPGALFEVPGRALEGPPPDSLNLHGFRWDHALYAGRQIFKEDFPNDVHVYLIEAQSLELGLELSPRIKATANKVVEKLLQTISEYKIGNVEKKEPLSDNSVVLRRGSLYLSAALYKRYFRNLETVILMRRDNDLFILPVANAAAGGYLLKLKNSAGDRVINATEFFYSNGIDDTVETDLLVQWNTKMAGLMAKAVFSPPR